MRRILVFGNSGSGKSTLAHRLGANGRFAHLDLDTLAWQETSPPERAPIEESSAKIEAFVDANESWVIEGGYSDLLAIVVRESSEIIFLNLPVHLCVENAQNRPWEPHKYKSKADQDANLDMLTSWITEYPTRDDGFSERAHEKLYSEYVGTKRMYTNNEGSS